MTEAFKEWVEDTTEDIPLGDEFEDTSPLSKRAAHFWDLAFVKEVERRAGESRPYYTIDYNNLGHAFLNVVRDFGLDGDK